MAYTTYRGKRVSKPHATLLNAYQRKYGVAVQLNQGARTLAEQWGFWNHYRKYGYPLAAYPTPAAPHIKWGNDNHALDINAGSGRGQAGHVAAFYRSLGVPVVFNVPSEHWHMDTLDAGKLRAAAKRFAGPPTLKRGAKGKSVVRLKKLLYAKGIRNFSGKRSSNRYIPHFGYYCQQAVKRYQRAHGLAADGIVGPATWRSLEK